jgi:hypothetical protein
VETAVRELWDDLQIVEDAAGLAFLKKKPKVAVRLAGLSDEEALAAIQAMKGGGVTERPVKQVELDALLAVPEGFGDDVPVDPNFLAALLGTAAAQPPEKIPRVGYISPIRRGAWASTS